MINNFKGKGKCGVLKTKTFGKIEMANAIFWIYLGGAP